MTLFESPAVLRSRRASGGRCAAVVIGSLLASGVLASSAAGEQRVVDLVSTGPAAGNGTSDSEFRGASSDGARVFFETTEPLVGADTDSQFDVYERSGGQTTLISAGGSGASGAGFAGASADGTRVVFVTAQSLVGADTDTAQDVYERSAGQTTLISTGPSGGNGVFSSQFSDMSADGTHVFFATEESLVDADTDTRFDVYERSGGETALVSTGPDGGNGPFDTTFVRVSADGTRAFLALPDSLVSADSDARGDVYERSGGQTTLISTGPDGGNGTFDTGFPQPSADGTHVMFDTAESLVSADTDAQVDLYERSGGQTTLVSTGPDGGNGPFDASLRDVSADGTRAFFHTSESLVSADSDSQIDVYERSGGQTTLISGGNGAYNSSFEGVSAGGARVLFGTAEPLVAADTDTRYDVYERSGGQTTLISGGNGAFEPSFEGVSADGARVWFSTAEPLVAADTDAEYDVYERSGGQTTLISKGNGAFESSFEGASADGTRVWFTTDESLTTADTDTARDVYVARIAPPPGNTTPPGKTTTPPATGPGPGRLPGLLPGACANVQSGAAAADRLTGSAFGDRLRGLAGNDVLIALAGDDCLAGGAGRDTLRGGAGKDKLTGGRGRDRLNGGSGNDRIRARDDRRETVRCGKGKKDRAIVDRIDRVVGCEKVERG